MTLSPPPADVTVVPKRTPLCEVREIDPADRTHTAWAAQMHCELFAEIGLVTKLGERVLRRFCYGRLIRDGLMRAGIAMVEGRPAGLIAFTTDSQAVHRAAVGSHFFVALRELIVATILDPRIVRGLPSAARLVWERRNEQPSTGPKVAETLVFGVRAEFRSHDFVRATGIRVSDRLMHWALLEMKALGVREARGVILAHNLPAVAFSRRGATRVQPYHNAAKPSVEIWYDIDRALQLAERSARRLASSIAAKSAIE
jgi:hypothetical protein